MENPFLKKLRLNPGHNVKIIDAPENAAAIFGNFQQGITVEYDGEGNFDVLVTFTRDKEQLNNQIKNNLKKINAKTIFWVFYPKKSSGITSDLELMKTWKALEVYGLSPCASVAVNEIWTGLRLKLITEIKPSGLRNDDIKNNAYGDYIDPDTKTVKLPDDFAGILSRNPAALQFFNKLAYSHRKEYVLWILSAKQNKTREARMEKALEMLVNEKKNPSAKG